MNWLGRVPGTAAWRRRRHVEVCVRTYERIQEMVDGEAPADDPECRRLIRHLETCPHCTAEAKAVQDLKEAIERVCCREADELADRMGPVIDRLLREGAPGEER